MVDSSSATAPMIVSVFKTQEATAEALDVLRQAGVTPEQVALIMNEPEAPAADAPDAGRAGASNAASGALGGGVVGGLTGWLLGVGALAIPGLGPVLGAGVLANVLTGAAVGAATGGLLGGLVGRGVPVAAAQDYEGHLCAGHMLLTIHPPDAATADRLRAILQAQGATMVRAYADGDEIASTTAIPLVNQVESVPAAPEERIAEHQAAASETRPPGGTSHEHP